MRRKGSSYNNLRYQIVEFSLGNPTRKTIWVLKLWMGNCPNKIIGQSVATSQIRKHSEKIGGEMRWWWWDRMGRGKNFNRSKQKRTFSSQSIEWRKGWNFNWKSFYNLNTVLQLVHPARNIALKFSSMRSSQCIKRQWSMWMEA